MAGSKVLQFFVLVSFVIFSTHALAVLLTDGKGENRFFYGTEIYVHVNERGVRHYNGCASNRTYAAGPATIKVIVYIKRYQKMTDTALRQEYEAKRVEIAETLSAHNYELLYLGVKAFKRHDQRLIAEFLLRSIEPNPFLPHFRIDTIGERSLDMIYPLPLYNLLRYREESAVFGGNLRGELRSMD